MAGISSKAAGKLENRYKFNSYELNTDFDINIGEAFFRSHDPQLGRWWQIDPKAIDFESPYSFGHNNPILFNDALGDTSELYDMDGNFLNTINNKGSLTRMMVDAGTYNTMYGNDTYKEADWDDQGVANGFMTGLEKTLTGLEKSTGNDYIAKETGLSISFTGDAKDYQSDGKTRQQGVGTLSINANFDNGKSASVAEFSAISGAGSNGLLPNGTYTTGKPYTTNKSSVYTDKQGTYFKIPLTPDKSIGIPSQGQGGRYALLIHPVGYGTSNPHTDGCIGITKGAGSFFQIVGGSRTPKLNVTVDIKNNANVKTQLGNKTHY